MTGLKNGTVKLCPHDDGWAVQAAATAAELKGIFGADAVAVRHVGSTAIHGIPAKPVIDIAVAVRDSGAVARHLTQLEAHGYMPREHGVENDTLLVLDDGESGLRTHHIHIVADGSMEWRNYVNFVDYLNAFPDKAREYASLKLALADKYPSDREAYTSGKADAVRFILRRAMVWSYMGKTVTCGIDRPLGYRHEKHGKVLIYPINYGYIPGVLGGDGEELDVYVYGIDRPLETFTGCVVGIVYRRDDVEDKLIAAPESMRPTAAELTQAVNFQEKYYDSYVEALYK